MTTELLHWYHGKRHIRIPLLLPPQRWATPEPQLGSHRQPLTPAQLNHKFQRRWFLSNRSGTSYDWRVEREAQIGTADWYSARIRYINERKDKEVMRGETMHDDTNGRKGHSQDDGIELEAGVHPMPERDSRVWFIGFFDRRFRILWWHFVTSLHVQGTPRANSWVGFPLRWRGHWRWRLRRMGNSMPVAAQKQGIRKQQLLSRHSV
jgi:hypothetical protein